MKPPRSILDASFRYVPSGKTDLRKTFARVKKQQREAAELAKATAAIVRPIRERKA